MAAFWIMSRVPTFPWFAWYFLVMSALFSSSGHHSTVREESFPYSLQKLHVNVCSEGQSWGQLHDHHDCHYGSWEKEPRGKHGYNEDMFRHKSLRFPQKTILYCSFRTLLLSVGFVEKLLLPLLSLCMHSFEEMYSITWLLNYGVIRGIHFSPSYWQIRSLTDFSNYFPQESISTCRFAQRVAVIKNEAILNEELDPALVRQSDARAASPGPRNSDAELHNHTTDPWLNVPFYFGQTLP